jgi:hypothetical protein
MLTNSQYLSRQYDAFDFRISNVLGEDMLTFIYPHNRTAVILDTHYNVNATIPVAHEGEGVDMHEFHVVDNGTRALFFFNERRKLPKEQSRAVGYMNGDCTIDDNAFRELDVADNFKPMFSWSAAEHIGLYESSEVGQSLQERCSKVRFQKRSHKICC